VSEVRTYHGQPVIKEPVWSWEIPLYFYTGGLGGASAGLAYLSELRGNRELAARAWLAAAAGVSASPILLTSDLGKPTRFINMFRMFKPTSPMSVGSWLLGASGAATTAAAASELIDLPPWVGRLAKPAAALFGLPLSTYTAALITNTAVPAWHEARRGMPFVFAAGAALSAGAAGVALTPPDKADAARRLALGAAVLEVGLTEAVEFSLGEHHEAYERGAAGRFSHLSTACIAAGAALLQRRGGRSQAAARIAGALLSAGALSARWSIFKAGFVSARDPKFVVGPQRANIEAGRRTGAARKAPSTRAVGATTSAERPGLTGRAAG
jgi:hypothetical protein